jgi:DNA-binding MarR family transcriptional regulator
MHFPTSITLNTSHFPVLVMHELAALEDAFEATELDGSSTHFLGFFPNFTPLTNENIAMSNTANELTWVLPNTVSFMVRRVQQVLEKENIELIPPQLAFLFHIAMNEDPVQTLMATQMGKDKSAILRQVDMFEERGWIERKIDPNDRRRKRLSLTPAGQEVLAKGRTIMEKVFGMACEGIPEADIAICIRVLTQMRTRVAPLLHMEQL